MHISRTPLINKGRQKRAELTIKNAQNNVIAQDDTDVTVDDFIAFCQNPRMLFSFYSTFGIARKIVNIPAKWSIKNWVEFEDETIAKKVEKYGLETEFYDWVRYASLYGRAYLLINKRKIRFENTETEIAPEIIALNNAWIEEDDIDKDYIMVYDVDWVLRKVERKYLTEMSMEDSQSVLLPMMSDLFIFLQSQYGILKHWQAAALHVVKSAEFDKMNKGMRDKVAERLNLFDVIIRKRNTVAIGANDSYERINPEIKIKDFTDWIETAICAVSEIPRIVLFDKSPTGGVNDAKSKGSNFTNFISNMEFCQKHFIRPALRKVLFKLFGNVDTPFKFKPIIELSVFEKEEIMTSRINRADKMLDMNEKVRQQVNNDNKSIFIKHEEIKDIITDDGLYE